MNSLTTALVTIRRSPYQALASILLVTVTFFMAYAFSFLLLGADQVLRYFETRPQIIAFFELDASQEAISSLQQSMQGKTYVTDVKVVSKEEALELYKQENQEDPLLLELVTADILPASIEVSGSTIQDLAQIKADLESDPNVEEVIYQKDVIDSLNLWTNTLRSLGMGLIGVMALISFLTITVITMMKATGKKRAIQIMRMIGATPWYIRSPFILEGALYGIIGSVLGWLAAYAGLLYLTPWIKEFIGEISVFPVPWQFLATQVGVGTAIGLMLGGLAGSAAVGRLIKH